MAYRNKKADYISGDQHTALVSRVDDKCYKRCRAFVYFGNEQTIKDYCQKQCIKEIEVSLYYTKNEENHKNKL